ncbi:SOSD1 protein, partial [Atractosteus spatula]|nr:SOSD1 protein [Atractosteus spatula]
MLLNTVAYRLLFLAGILVKGYLTFKNDATEILYTHVVHPVQDHPVNASLNQARNGGRNLGHTGSDRNDQSQVGCRELRSTKYISDGQCTSINPVKELVCAGECLPAEMLPNWIGGGGGSGRKYWSRRNAQEWRCVNDKTRTQRIQLQCRDGSTRTYKITVVTSCRCKRYSRQHNESSHKFGEASRPNPPHQHRGKKRQGKASAHSVNWHELEAKN